MTTARIAELVRRGIDAKEVGCRLGCSARSVYRLADAGRIPWGFKLGSLRRWDSASIDAFLAGKSAKGRP
jgi:predicted DNA-binding transcriptional regulator AlpA